MPTQIVNPDLNVKIGLLQDMLSFVGACAASCAQAVSDPVTPPLAASPAHAVAAEILATYDADETADRKLLLYQAAWTKVLALSAEYAALPPTIDAP